MALEWARLLQQQQDDGKLGLTPSFLIGALRGRPGTILGMKLGFAELCVLMEMMRDEHAPEGKVVSIFECQRILQPVATLSTADQHGDPIESSAGGPVRLFVWPWISSSRPVDFGWLVKAIWDHFGSAISAGNFSYNPSTRQFGTFDKCDLDFIGRALVESDESY